MGVIDFLLALMQDMILAAIPAIGFAMVFNVPHRALPWCGLLGAIGHGSRMIMISPRGGEGTVRAIFWALSSG